MEADLGLDGTTSTQDRRTQALLVTAWDEARRTRDKKATIKAEHKASGQVNQIEVGEHESRSKAVDLIIEEPSEYFV